jgi:hypothetical protein
MKNKYVATLKITPYFSSFKKELESKIEEDCPWINDIYDMDESQFSSQSVYPLVNEIAILFESSDFNLIDKILDNIDYSRLNTPFMVSLLRVTSSGKCSLKKWRSSLLGVSNILKSRAEDVDRHLRGLVN